MGNSDLCLLCEASALLCECSDFHFCRLDVVLAFWLFVRRLESPPQKAWKFVLLIRCSRVVVLWLYCCQRAIELCGNIIRRGIERPGVRLCSAVYLYCSLRSSHIDEFCMYWPHSSRQRSSAEWCGIAWGAVNSSFLWFSGFSPLLVLSVLFSYSCVIPQLLPYRAQPLEVSFFDLLAHCFRL